MRGELRRHIGILYSCFNHFVRSLLPPDGYFTSKLKAPSKFPLYRTPWNYMFDKKYLLRCAQLLCPNAQEWLFSLLRGCWQILARMVELLWRNPQKTEKLGLLHKPTWGRIDETPSLKFELDLLQRCVHAINMRKHLKEFSKNILASPRYRLCRDGKSAKFGPLFWRK